MTDAELEAVHVLYRNGHTIRQIAEGIWSDFGYASAETCRRSLYKSLRANGYAVRTLRESNQARRTHGYATKLIRTTYGGRSRYLKWWRRGMPE